MKNLLLLLACLSISSTAVRSQWSWQNPLPQGNALSTISFVDSINGWATGAGGILMRTTDGGDHWQVIHTPRSEMILQHSFTSPLSGWVLYYASNKVYHTTDGGKTWDSVSTPPTIPPSNSDDLRSICFINGSVGLLGGWYGNILRTADAGKTWTPVTTTIKSIVLKFQFLNADTGFAFTNSSDVLVTTDAGRTWTPFPQNYVMIGNVANAFFTDLKTGWLAGSRGGIIPYTTVGVLSKTTDGGATWTYSSFPDPLTDVYFSSPSEGWVANTQGTIFHTSDGGQTWEILAGKATNFFFIGPSRSWGILGGTQIDATTDGWRHFTAQTTRVTSANLWALTVPDTKNAFACGDNATILGTADQGGTWTRLFDSTASTISLNGITCKGGNEIWAVGSRSVVMHSADRGLHWETRTIADTAVWLSDIAFVDDTVGCIVSSGVNGIIYRTADGGRTWKVAASVSSALNKIAFPRPQLGWIAGDHAIYRSTDGGMSWKEAASTVFSMDMCARGDTAWFPLGNGVFFTADAGATWKTHEVVPVTNTLFSVRSISFADSRHGWAAISDGRVCRTDDAGITWHDDSLRTSSALFGIRFASPNRGWIVGTGGVVLRYDNISTSVGHVVRTEIPSECRLSQNYPNPFNPTTTISFSIPSKTFVSLKLFDALGREVSTLASEELPAGTHARQWNAAGASSGVYFYRLQAGAYTETRRLLLIR